MFGGLQRAICGTRDAAAAWEREWTKTLNSVGFKSGVSNPALLHCKTLDASMVVHGDDFITLGDNEALSEVERAMSDHYTIKVRAILVQVVMTQGGANPEPIRALEIRLWEELDGV